MTKPILHHYHNVVVHIDADESQDVLMKTCSDAILIIMDDEDRRFN